MYGFLTYHWVQLNTWSMGLYKCLFEIQDTEAVECVKGCARQVLALKKALKSVAESSPTQVLRHHCNVFINVVELNVSDGKIPTACSNKARDKACSALRVIDRGTDPYGQVNESRLHTTDRKTTLNFFYPKALCTQKRTSARGKSYLLKCLNFTEKKTFEYEAKERQGLRWI